MKTIMVVLIAALLAGTFAPGLAVPGLTMVPAHDQRVLDTLPPLAGSGQ